MKIIPFPLLQVHKIYEDTSLFLPAEMNCTSVEHKRQEPVLLVRRGQRKGHDHWADHVSLKYTPDF